MKLLISQLGVSLAARLENIIITVVRVLLHNWVDFRMNIVQCIPMIKTSTMKPHNGADLPFRIRKRLENLLRCPFSAFWTLLREKPTKSLILYQFLRQGLRKDAKSDRNWCIWCQLLCDPTVMKHHNIHKTTKIHVFHKESSKKITDMQAKWKYVTKNLQKSWKLANFYDFSCWKKLSRFLKKATFSLKGRRISN